MTIWCSLPFLLGCLDQLLTGPRIFVQGEWIVHRQDCMLWLPPEHMQTSSLPTSMRASWGGITASQPESQPGGCITSCKTTQERQPHPDPDPPNQHCLW